MNLADHALRLLANPKANLNPPHTERDTVASLMKRHIAEVLSLIEGGHGTDKIAKMLGITRQQCQKGIYRVLEPELSAKAENQCKTTRRNPYNLRRAKA